MIQNRFKRIHFIFLSYSFNSIIVDLHFSRVFPLNGQDSLLYGEKLVLEKLESLLILFYFKRENKTRKKPLKKWLHSFWKSLSLKNPSLGPVIRLSIGKVPLKGNTPLSPIRSLLTKLREMWQLIWLIIVPR